MTVGDFKYYSIRAALFWRRCRCATSLLVQPERECISISAHIIALETALWLIKCQILPDSKVKSSCKFTQGCDMIRHGHGHSWLKSDAQIHHGWWHYHFGANLKGDVNSLHILWEDAAMKNSVFWVIKLDMFFISQTHNSLTHKAILKTAHAASPDKLGSKDK